VRRVVIDPEALDALGHRFAQARARKGAGDDRDERDSALHGREESAGIGGKVEGALRAGAPGLGHRLQPRLARRDDRQLAHRQHAVHQDQREDDEDVEPGYGE
jgi:hypothetical protein